MCVVLLLVRHGLWRVYVWGVCMGYMYVTLSTATRIAHACIHAHPKQQQQQQQQQQKGAIAQAIYSQTFAVLTIEGALGYPLPQRWARLQDLLPLMVEVLYASGVGQGEAGAVVETLVEDVGSMLYECMTGGCWCGAVVIVVVVVWR